VQSRSEVLRLLRFVRRLIEGGALNHRPPARGGVQERYWRRVPKVDVLPSRQVKFSGSLVARGLLVLVLVIGVFLAQKEYRDRLDLDSAKEAKTAQLASLQRQLADKRQEVDPVRGEIAKLKGQLTGAEQAYRQATAGHIDWYVAIEALLLSTETSGVRFSSVTTKPGGDVTLVGQATDPLTVATLPKQLQDISNAIELQGIQWKPGSNPPEFTAVFKVRP
jgi:hypothetical protein